MAEQSNKSVVEQELKRLERRLDELVGAVSQLKDENRALRQRQDACWPRTSRSARGSRQ
jgi:uncharacterized membrane protein